MTKKDYELIADCINRANTYCQANKNREGITMIDGIETLGYLTGILAFELKSDNPRFNNEKFAKASRLSLQAGQN